MPPVISPLVFPTSTTTGAAAPRSAASTSRSPLRAGVTPRGGGGGARSVGGATTNQSRGASPALLRGSLMDISRRLQGLNSRHASPAVGRRAQSPGPNSGPTALVETVTKCQAASPPKSVSSVPRSRSPGTSIRQTPSFRSTSSLAGAASPSRQEHSIGVEPTTDNTMSASPSAMNRNRRTSVVTISKATISRTSSFNSSAPSHSATTTRNINSTTAGSAAGGGGGSGVGSRRGSASSLKNNNNKVAASSGAMGRTSTVVPSQTLVRVRGSTPRGRPSPQSTPRAASANRWRRGDDEGEVLGTLEGHTKTVDVVAERVVDPRDGNAYIYTTTTTTTEPLHPSSLSQPSRPPSLFRPPSLALLTSHHNQQQQQNGGQRGSFRYVPSNNGPRLQSGGDGGGRGTASPVRSNVSTPRNGPSSCGGHQQQQRGFGTGVGVGIRSSSTSRPQTPTNGVRRAAPLMATKIDSPRTRTAMSTSPTRHVPTTTTTTNTAAPKSPTRLRSSSPAAAVASASTNGASSPPTAAPRRSTSPVLTRGVTAARAERWVTEFEEHLRTEKLPYLEWKKLDVRGKQQMMDKWRVPEMKRRVILEC